MEYSQKNADVLPETKMPLLQPSYTEQTDVTETENWLHDVLDIAATETKTIRYDLMLQDNADSVDTLNSKELEELQICEVNSTLTEEKVITVGSDETHRGGEASIALMQMLENKMYKKVSLKRNKKKSQSLIDVKKEDSKKTTRKSNKTMLLPANLDQTHRRIGKRLRKYNVKSELHKNQTGRCLRNTISPLAVYVQSNDTNSTFNTNISCRRITEEQVLNQHYMMNTSQHLYYSDMKYNDQEIMSTNSNPWLMTPMYTRDTTLSDNIPNMMQTENHFIDNAQYSTSTDGNWKQEKNPCMSDHSIDFTESYDLFNSEDQACYNVYDLSYTGDDKYNDPRNFSNVRFQQVPTDITLNFITSTAASNNSLNATSGLFNDFQYNQPLQTDGYFNRLYYTDPEIAPMADYADNSESEIMITRNVMLPQNGDMPIWHHVNDVTAYNNHLNIPLHAHVPSWSNVLPSYPLYTDDNIDASINASVQLDDLYKRDALIKINLVNQLNTERETFVNPYVEYVFEDTLPATDMHTLNPYEDDGLINTLSHESYTPNSAEDRITSDMTNFFSETNSAEESNLM